MKRLGSFIARLVNISGHVFGWLVPIMILLILFEVFMRYVVGQPPIIAEEFGAYMLVALSYLGLAYTWREKGHVRITALVDRLPTRVSGWLRLITLVFAFVLTLALTHSGYTYLALSFKTGMIIEKSTFYVPECSPIICPLN